MKVLGSPWKRRSDFKNSFSMLDSRELSGTFLVLILVLLFPYVYHTFVCFFRISVAWLVCPT